MRSAGRTPPCLSDGEEMTGLDPKDVKTENRQLDIRAFRDAVWHGRVRLDLLASPAKREKVFLFFSQSIQQRAMQGRTRRQPTPENARDGQGHQGQGHGARRRFSARKCQGGENRQ